MSEITKHESMEEFYARTKAEEESARREALRDRFAGLALQGILARPHVDLTGVTTIAGAAYDFANAMLVARESKP